ncbi:MAG: peptide-methionine (S)-S-oxide reductase MsrA [Turneriella sp.]|nr:peptide-methionine (S)-S-oxide reductase MsrA [Turneriella sp.]
MKLKLWIVFVSLISLSCGDKAEAGKNSGGSREKFSFPRPFENPDPKLKSAIFAGGCFWCMVSPFEKVKGVKGVISGYSGGKEKNPTYEEVSYGGTSHAESVLVLYDPKQVTYEKLLDTYWRSINPEQDDGQFYDRGDHYKTYIFYGNKEEKAAAEKSKAEVAASGKYTKIAVQIKEAKEFWPAEDYHQDYYKKKPAHYYQYYNGSGRKAYLESKWGKPSSP